MINYKKEIRRLRRLAIVYLAIIALLLCYIFIAKDNGIVVDVISSAACVDTASEEAGKVDFSASKPRWDFETLPYVEKLNN